MVGRQEDDLPGARLVEDDRLLAKAAGLVGRQEAIRDHSVEAQQQVAVQGGFPDPIQPGQGAVIVDYFPLAVSQLRRAAFIVYN